MPEVSFAPAPGWPPAEPGWVPSAEWRPPQSWPAAPDGWVFYRGSYGEPAAPPPGNWDPQAPDTLTPPDVAFESRARRPWLATALVGIGALVAGGLLGAWFGSTALGPTSAPSAPPATAPASPPAARTPQVCITALDRADQIKSIAESVLGTAIEGMQALTEGEYDGASDNMDKLSQSMDELFDAGRIYDDASGDCRAKA